MISIGAPQKHFDLPDATAVGIGVPVSCIRYFQTVKACCRRFSAKSAATPDPIFPAIERCRELEAHSQARYARVSACYRDAKAAGLGDDAELFDRNAYVEAMLGFDPDAYTDETATAWWDAVGDLFEVEPTTLAGILALLRFAEALAEAEQTLVEENSILLVATMAAAVDALSSRGAA